MAFFSSHKNSRRVLRIARRLVASGRSGAESGFALVELLVAILILSIAVAMSTELYVSNLNSTNDINQRMQMNDYADFTKGWLSSNVATADVPPVAGSWHTLVVNDAENSLCYQLSIDIDNAELEARQAADCATVAAASALVLSNYISNTETKPLFIYYDKQGNIVNPQTQLAQVRQVDVSLRLDSNDDNLPAVTRVLSYALGGSYRDNDVNGPINGSDLVDGSVTNAKIADGAITGDKFADGSIGAAKLTEATRASSFRFPLISDSDEVWSAGSTTSWTLGPKDAYQRVGITLGDYCSSGKILEARGAFVAYNRASPAQGLRLRFRLVRDDGAGGSANEYAASLAPGADNVPASGFALITTPWQSVNCVTPETAPFFYSIQTLAQENGSQDKNFSLVHAALELRYR